MGLLNYNKKGYPPNRHFSKDGPIGKIIAKDNLNIENLMQTFENLILQTTQQNSSILHTNSPWVCVIKVCSNGGATYIIYEIVAKDNLNIENLMQSFENFLLQNY